MLEKADKNPNIGENSYVKIICGTAPSHSQSEWSAQISQTASGHFSEQGKPLQLYWWDYKPKKQKYLSCRIGHVGPNLPKQNAQLYWTKFSH